LQETAIKQFSLKIRPDLVVGIVSAILGPIVAVDATSAIVAGEGFEDRLGSQSQHLPDLAVAQSLAVAKFQNSFHVQVLYLLVDSSSRSSFLELAFSGSGLLSFLETLIHRLDVVLWSHPPL